MSVRSGPFKNLRTAATFVAVNTWYNCTSTIQMGKAANSLKLFVDIAVATALTIEFKVEVSEGGTNFYEQHRTEGLRVFGPFDAAVGSYTFDLEGLNLSPTEVVRLSFRCSAGAASATVGVLALAFDSNAVTDRSSVMFPKYRDVCAVGNGDLIALTTTIPHSKRFKSISAIWTAGVAPVAVETFDITIVRSGAANNILISINPATLGVYNYFEDFEEGIALSATDEILVSYANTNDLAIEVELVFLSL